MLIMNRNVGGKWKEIILVYFQAKFRNFARKILEINEKQKITAFFPD